MFLDNLRLHHGIAVKEWADKEGLRLLFNAPYSSPYNPIEWLWAFSKRKFYRDEMVIEKELKYADVEAYVKKYITEVPKETILKCVEHVLRSSREYLQNCNIDKLREDCAELDAIH